MNRVRTRARLVVFAVAALVPLRSGAEQAGTGPIQVHVTNGVVAGDRPTTGALLTRSSSYYESICSGTLVGCETFVTAAHCVCDDSPFSQCGTPSPAGHAVYLQDVGIVGVAAIDVDPTYDFSERGDIAVITLSSPVTGVAPTPINETMRPPFGTTVEIAGYGITSGTENDAGMLRRGLAETSACTEADPAWHVCWSFEDPLGLPGIDSNTCNGDSGGPLFADLGSGVELVGVTSGGTSADCLPTDASYDTDVFVHQTFLENVAGGDLLNSSCGTIAQVGEPGATRFSESFDALGKIERACRKEFAKQYSAYVTGSLRAMQSCFDGVAAGSRTAPCPDAQAALELGEAADRVSLEKLLSRCPDYKIPAIRTAGVCAGSTSVSDLVTCIYAAGDQALGDALASEYADDDPMDTITDADERQCQGAVGAASAALLRSSLKAATRCQSMMDKGKAVSCPDAKTSEKLATAETKATTAILAACSNAAVSGLDSDGTFGGTCAGVTTAAALAACEIADHETVRSDLVALLDDSAMTTSVSFPVPPGTAVLRVTLNGKDNGSNDLDLYVRGGAPASTTTFDESSENGGMFESIEIASPAAGTWHAHISRYAGEKLISYQLTATAFQP